MTDDGGFLYIELGDYSLRFRGCTLIISILYSLPAGKSNKSSRHCNTEFLGTESSRFWNNKTLQIGLFVINEI